MSQAVNQRIGMSVSDFTAAQVDGINGGYISFAVSTFLCGLPSPNCSKRTVEVHERLRPCSPQCWRDIKRVQIGNVMEAIPGLYAVRLLFMRTPEQYRTATSCIYRLIVVF